MTHGLGALVSGVALIPLMVFALRTGIPALGISTAVYGVTQVAVYVASSLSHAIVRGAWRRRVRKWDQGLIYLLIVTTYTPIAVALLPLPWHGITGIMWVLALGGFLSKVAWVHRVEKIAVWLYVAIGWLPALALPKLLSLAPFSVVMWIVAGGIAYTMGVAILLFDRHARYLHTMWHLFVMLGGACHYLAIWESLRAVQAG